MTHERHRILLPSERLRRACVALAVAVTVSSCDRGGETLPPGSAPEPSPETDVEASPSRDGRDGAAAPEEGDGAAAVSAGTQGTTPSEPNATAEGTEVAAPTDAPAQPDAAATNPSEPAGGARSEPVAGRGQPAPLPKVIHAKTNASCGKAAGVGQSLRDFDLPLIGGEGKRLTKRSLRGKVSLVNLWGTWCEPCKKELPEFARLYRHYRAHGLSFVAIATDEDPTPVVSFAKSRKLAGRLAYDGEAYSKTFGERSFPFTFVVDRQGTILAAYDGYREECLGQLEADVRAALVDAR